MVDKTTNKSKNLEPQIPGQANPSSVPSLESVAFLIHDDRHTILQLNERAEELIGIENRAARDSHLMQFVDHQSWDLLEYHLRRVSETKRPSSVELILRRHDETLVDIVAETSLLSSGLFQTVMVDISTQKDAQQESKKFRAKLLQSQKLEILYQLSGGIAHDFNNLLHVLSIHSELAQLLVDEKNERLANAIEEIVAAVDRGTQLTNRLLAFSRQQPLIKERTDLNQIVDRSLSMIRTTLGRKIELEVDAFQEPLGVWVDAVQIEQLLLNLCINSRDAMNGSGRLTISTERVERTEPSTVSGLELYVGSYAKLIVSDTGNGIPASIRERLFEPFTTTKNPGKGTGLGMAIVYNILKDHEGGIEIVESSEAGTTIEIYLPRFRVSTALSETSIGSVFDYEKLKEFEVALIAEDEQDVRESLARLLEASGLTVLTAENGADAIRLLDQHPEISLVLSDLVMPVKGGLEVCEHFRNQNSDGTLVLISSHGDSLIDKNYLIGHNTYFIEKPVMISELENHVRSNA